MTIPFLVDPLAYYGRELREPPPCVRGECAGEYVGMSAVEVWERASEIMSDKRQLTFGSLFAGIGGFDLGFERAGMTCKWQVEIDPYCRKVLEKHWPSVRRHDDVRTFPPTDADEWRVDVICGGFPCQDISYAGRGAGLAGKRSGLWYEYARIVSEVGPRFVVVENVAALANRGLDAVLGTLSDLGFDAEWGVVPAAAFGSPQYRERLFLLAYAQRDGRNTHAPNGNASRVRGASQATCGHGAAETTNARSGRQSVSTRPDSLDSRGDDRLHSRIAPWQFSGAWRNEPDLVRVADGVPDGLDRLHGLGNAVVPQVAEWIGRRLMQAVEQVPVDMVFDERGLRPLEGNGNG